jgi:protein-L-isoaspartate O-methyltransferase
VVTGTDFHLRLPVRTLRYQDVGGDELFAPVRPWPLPARQESAFYHYLDLPGGESIHNANWDLRGRFESYIGGYPVRGKTVLDVGTASGFLAFSAEEAGAARVTTVDALHAREFERIPFKGSAHTADRRRWITDTEVDLTRLKKAFWYAWHKKNGAVEVVYAPASQLWRWDRKFDVVIAGAIVEHLSDPVPFLTALAGPAYEAVIIACTQVVDADRQFMQTLSLWGTPRLNYSRWNLSRGVYKRIFSNLGFECEFSLTTAKCNEFTSPIEVQRPTIVAKRQAS